MKILILLFFVGFGAASVYDALDDAAELIYQDFLLCLEEAGPLKEALGVSDDEQFADVSEDDIKTELGKKLKELLDNIREKIKEGIEKGKGIREEYLEKLKEIKEKLKDLKGDVGEKAKELYKKVRDRVKDYLRELLDKLSDKKERSVDDIDIEIVLGAFNFKDMLNKLKDSVLKKIDKEKLKAMVEKLFGKGSEIADNLLKLLNEKGDEWRKKVHDLIDRYLGKKEEKRSIKEVWEKIKNYFKDLQIDLKEKYAKFGSWVKEVIGKGLEKSKDKLDNIKQIAREFINRAKDVQQDVANEALDFFRPYKEDLGNIWKQVKDSVKDIINKKS